MKLWCLYILSLLCCTRVYSQQFPNIQFDYLTEKEGLSSNTVGCIAQDREGFIWIATGDGLDRYDGYRVKHFFHSPTNENSLVNNSVHQIVPDACGRLWVTTREGISVYEKKTGLFRNFRHNPADTTSLDNDQYASVYATKNNSVWVTTASSVYHFDSSLRYKRISSDIKVVDETGRRKTGSYRQVIRDTHGNLWGCNGQYVFLIDEKNMHPVKRFGPFAGNIEAIYQDSSLRFWIGSFGGGLMEFKPSVGEIVPVNIGTSVTIVHSITEWRDPNHNRWLVLGADNGLILVDPISLRSREYNFHLGYFPQEVLTKNVVQYVFVDRQNILWLGTEAGVCYAKPARQLFDLWNIAGPSRVGTTAVADWIYSICSVSNGYWMTRWVGSNLFYFNKDGVLTDSLVTMRTANGNVVAISGSLKPYYIMSQGDSVLWFTTDEFLVHYNLKSRIAALYKPPDGQAYTGLRTVTIVNKHAWWIRTRNNGPNGIYIFDPATRRFTKHFSHSAGRDDCVPADLLTIFLNRKRELYVTAVGKGLFRYDPETDRFISIFRFQGKDLLQHSNSFESIAEDNQGILWIATYTGLFALDPAFKKPVRDYTSDAVLGGVDVSGIVFDEGQNAWLNTERGIYYILHATGQPHRLTTTAGLKNNSNGIFQEGEDHSIYDGIQGYLVRIRPAEVLDHHNQRVPVHFSDATVMDTPTFFHFSSSGQKQMIIRPGQNRFSIDFSVMNYDGDNRYYYRLDGIMNDWQQNENGHLAFYNLSPGKYTLRVKGSDISGDLETGEDEVTIFVQPHWWQTGWFKLSWMALIVALATFLMRRRIIQIRHEASFKQKIAETEMMALRSQMNPHFIFNSLNSIENFMMQNEKRLASSYLNKFARLIRMILDSSRNELVPLAKDMEALQLYVDLEQLRFNHKFCFKTYVDPLLMNGDYKVPALLVQPYVENAIIHGLAHSEKTDLVLEVSAALEGDHIHYKIQDNGIGRRLSSMYNRQNKPHHKSVGLKITEERIHILNEKQHGDGCVNISDLVDELGQAAGTRVDIKIKAA